MPSIFLSHTNIDKPFVEKLANDLTRLGVKAWFDKWEIKVGESLFWKIEKGIRANEYLGIVLSPEALDSEWVRSELSAAWIKQINLKRIFILPILYRACDIPLLLQDRKYADFKENYDFGLSELAAVFGIKNTELISLDNWRKFKNDQSINWRIYKDEEFSLLVTKLVNSANEFNWSAYVGGKGSYSICLHAFLDQNRKSSVSIRLDGKTNAYLATLKEAYNPNRFKASDFNIYIGNTINEVEEYIWRIMEDFNVNNGNPTKKGYHQTHKFLSDNEKYQVIKESIQKMNWYKGSYS
jgi:hypothetical protein